MTQNPHAPGVPGGCPDLDTLADLHAGVLDATTAAALRAHVDSCDPCTEVLAALDATVASLAAMPAVQVPANIAARIDHALAVESGRAVDRDVRTSPISAGSAPGGPRLLGTGAPTQPSVPPAPPPSSAVSSLDEHRRKRAMRGRMLMVAAAAAVVIGGGAIALSQSGEDPANQAGDRSASNDAGGRPADDVQAFASPREVLQNGAIEDNQVSEEVAGKMAEQSARIQCLSDIVPRPASAPEAVQAGEYDGTPAYAFVFATDDPATVEMIIVDAADCANRLDTVTGPR